VRVNQLPFETSSWRKRHNRAQNESRSLAPRDEFRNLELQLPIDSVMRW